MYTKLPVALALVVAISIGIIHISMSVNRVQEQVLQSAKTVVVQPGDTLGKIAQANYTSSIRLYDANTTIKDPGRLQVGAVIRIPTAEEVLPNRPLPDQALAAIAATLQTIAQPPVLLANYNSGSVWDRIAVCESGSNWSTNTGNGYYGGLQFKLSSWQLVGGAGYPNQASREEQIIRAQRLQALQGWGAWPVCSVKIGVL